MPLLPAQLILSLQGLEGFDQKAFEEVHYSGEQITSVRINPLKWTIDNGHLTTPGQKDINPFSEYSPLWSQQAKIPWTQYGYYLRERPSFTFDPIFHAGCYYVQEASSMFLEQAIIQTMDLSNPLKVLDLSAAPGGKSTHIQSLISEDSLMVSNDTIRSRANILKDNIIKWGCSNVIVTNNDAADFSRLENYFDLVVVDAPCSGSGLFRKDPAAIEEWSESNVQLCAQRQQRILSAIWPALKKDGILIYSTCSYSKEEDEDIAGWMKDNLSIANCQLSIKEDWGIEETSGGYRFWPHKVKGEGFFIAVFRKKDGTDETSFSITPKVKSVNKNEKVFIDKWVGQRGVEFIKHDETVYAWSSTLVSDFHFLLQELRVIYSGTRVGSLVRDKLIPDHALAMSQLVRSEIPTIAVDYDQAIDYLKRKDLKIKPEQTGWQLIEYMEKILGWVNVLPNRINNYYPKEMRILKDN